MLLTKCKLNLSYKENRNQKPYFCLHVHPWLTYGVTWLPLLFVPSSALYSTSDEWCVVTFAGGGMKSSLLNGTCGGQRPHPLVEWVSTVWNELQRLHYGCHCGKVVLHIPVCSRLPRLTAQLLLLQVHAFLSYSTCLWLPHPHLGVVARTTDKPQLVEICKMRPSVEILWCLLVPLFRFYLGSLLVILSSMYCIWSTV